MVKKILKTEENIMKAGIREKKNKNNEK